MNERYFFASYSHSRGFGNVLLIEDNGTMVSRKRIKGFAKSQGCEDVIILNIFEFKSREDYYEFKEDLL